MCRVKTVNMGAAINYGLVTTCHVCDANQQFLPKNCPPQCVSEVDVSEVPEEQPEPQDPSSSESVASEETVKHNTHFLQPEKAESRRFAPVRITSESTRSTPAKAKLTAFAQHYATPNCTT